MTALFSPFIYDPHASRVLFGAGRLAEVAAEAERLDGRRVLIVTTSGRRDLAEQVATLLGERCVGIHDRAVPHVPIETVQTAVSQAQQRQTTLIVAVGGGSTIGLAKGMALETRLPILAIPTTYSGSEMTHIWGISENGRKTTGRDPVVKPQTVIYDPELLLSLPPDISLTSGVNAMAHAVEALYAVDRNPVASLLAEESVRQLAHSLPRVVQTPKEINGRFASLYGAWLAATVLDMVSMSLHHKLCHTLGGRFNLPHADTHTVLLPYVVAYNYHHAPEAMAALARALDCPVTDVAGCLQDLSRQHGGPVSLAELGIDAAHLPEAAVLATQRPYANPRPVTQSGVLKLLEAATAGKRPFVGQL